jgi:hypothetical protein
MKTIYEFRAQSNSVAKRRSLWQAMALNMGKWLVFGTGGVILATLLLMPIESHGAPTPANDATKPLAQIHFAGAQALGASTDLKTLNEILQLPETIKLREQAFGTLSTNGARGWASGGPKGKEVSPALLRPLLDDLYNFESRIEVYPSQDGPPLCLLAIRAPREATQRWSTNLWQAAQSAYGSAPKKAELNGLTGWQVQEAKRFFGVFQKGEWTLVASGSQAPNAQRGLVATLGEGSPPKADGFLSIQLSERALAASPSLRPFANISLAFTGKEDSVRTTGKLDLVNAFQGRITPWNVPTNTIRQTLHAFTAINGASSWLSNSPALAGWPIQRWPNQLYIWSEALSPFAVSGAAEVGNLTNFLHELKARKVEGWNAVLKTNLWGEINLIEEPLILSWRGLPIAVPFIRPAAEGDKGFAQFGLFPAPPGKDPMPQELLNQLHGRKNLLYYDWEITQFRLLQLRLLRQLHLMMTLATLPNAESAGEQWLAAVEPKLGNTITEVTLPSSKQLELTRKSHIGLSATEISALALWLQSTNFPALKLDFTGGPLAMPRRNRTSPAPTVQPPQ